MDEPELRRELLAAFEAEYREHLHAMRAALDAGPVSGAALRDVFRRAHSLKGAARAVELPEVESIAHGLETLLYRAVERDAALPADAAATVARGLDSIEARMRAPDAAPPAAAGPDGAAGSAAAPDLLPPADQALLRVQAAEIDHLGEAVHAWSDAMQQQDRVRTVLARTEAELRALVRLSETGTPGELDLRLRELSRQVSAERRSGAARDWQLDQAAQAVRSGMERVTLVGADSVFEPLAGMARELAREQGDEVAVRLSGLALRAERRVLQALRDPAIQMLRNAVSHGLRRVAAAQDRDGAARAEIGLSLRSRRGRLELAVTDNGAGPDLPAIAATARARGLLAADAPAPDEAQLLALVFEPGFSTAAAVDRLSGRGMGLSIVAEAAHRLHGTARMRCRRDRAGRIRGTELLVSVPLAARRQVLLLVEAGGHVFGLPANAVARLLRVPPAAVQRLENRPVARLPEGALPEGALPEGALPEDALPERLLELGALARLLDGSDALRDPDRVLPVAVLSGSGGRFGLVVERLREVRSLLVRAPELVGLDRELVAGMALVEQGRPVPVLEPDALVARLRAALPAVPADAPAPAGEASRPEAARPQATILVVDDSITTRTLEKTILQAQGYRVLIAVDGMEALGMLRTAQWEVDVVVADVEMPRLDGFGLLAAMNADPRLRGIPTVLMTSRSAESDVKRGLELGARAYIAKQEFDQGRLLATIGQLLP